jgi:hypothetical protein
MGPLFATPKPDKGATMLIGSDVGRGSTAPTRVQAKLDVGSPTTSTSAGSPGRS